ncbi:predicted protein [Pyrenophora tritici-repentis Pt-1C-BFP]|uniref:Uncharacterized protein n=1 Tax=Pyrenophora tritici-repentis (strain Pt-1C-BFP) TaxID=426418 RepID=B2WHL4_PYRTR|nr:uncharacterized protein PTRG_09473 [Pyrenophora tritici-repentis Pt-1C-BFP]EDU42524.1 predicted protein [Pyrenophora tritici-repentis Pt-1C-BFP]
MPVVSSLFPLVRQADFEWMGGGLEGRDGVTVGDGASLAGLFVALIVGIPTTIVAILAIMVYLRSNDGSETGIHPTSQQSTSTEIELRNIPAAQDPAVPRTEHSIATAAQSVPATRTEREAPVLSTAPTV